MTNNVLPDDTNACDLADIIGNLFTQKIVKIKENINLSTHYTSGKTGQNYLQI